MLPPYSGVKQGMSRDWLRMNKSFHNIAKSFKSAVFCLFLSLFGHYPLSAQLTETTIISFGGGVDYKTDCADVQDDRACDSNNMASYFSGTTQRRYGSDRIIDQAISSVPVKGLYRASYSTGSTVYRTTLMVNDGKIYVDTTNAPTGHIWTERKSGLNKNQNYEFKQYAYYILIVGDSLDDKVLRYNIQTDSVTENYADTGAQISPIRLSAKHHVFAKNYHLLGNVKEFTSGTTYYPSRVHYSLLIDSEPYINITSMTAFRWFDVSNDGEEITGMGEIGDVHIFKPSSINELQFDILNLGSQGGDQSLNKKVSGVGCIAPRTLVSNGKFYTFLSKDGIRVYDPTGRLTASDETKVISTLIDTTIKRILEAGTYKSAHAVYYGKRNWYVFSYEDPLRYPKGRPNHTLIYDFSIGDWFPFDNLLPETWATFDSINDQQELVYGDSNDGYAYYVDQEIFQNDARKEIVIDNCDVPSRWLRSEAGAQIKEGTASIRMTMPAATMYSSVTFMGIINLGEWYDKSVSTKADKISFKVYPSSLANLQSLRIDLELNTVRNEFDAYFTSVTISSNALVATSSGSLVYGTSNWSTIEVSLSSFPILSTWTQVNTGVLPFANTPTYYGLRFVSTSIGWCQLTIDDIRFVKDKETELNAFRTTKHFNLGTSANKYVRQIIIDVDQPATSKFYIDAYSDFGESQSREVVENTFDKDIYLSGKDGTEGIFRLNGNDFSIVDSTQVFSSSAMAARGITADKDFVYVTDQYNDRIMKFNRDSLNTLISTVGSSGSGTGNFDTPFQIAVTERDGNKTLYICDFSNHRVNIYNGNTMKVKKTFGSLGKGATNFYFPSGVAADDTDLFIVQDANHRLQKWNANTLEYKDSVILNLNTVGNSRLAVDQKFVYVYYSKISEDNLIYSTLWLEQRNKSDLKLVNKTRILPQNVTVVASTYVVMGDVGINDDYIYVTFTDGFNKKQWIQTTQTHWSTGIFGVLLDTTSIAGDVIFSTRTLQDDFEDGNYTENLVWSPVSGNYLVTNGRLTCTTGEAIQTNNTVNVGTWTFNTDNDFSSAQLYPIFNGNVGYMLEETAFPNRVRLVLDDNGINPVLISSSIVLADFVSPYSYRISRNNEGVFIISMLDSSGFRQLGTATDTEFFNSTVIQVNGGCGGSNYVLESMITTIPDQTFNSTFTSLPFNTGKNIVTFGTIETSSTLNNGTISYRLFTDTDSIIDINVASTFIASQTIVNSTIPTIAVNQYLTVSVAFSRSFSTYTPTLHSIIMNFDKGNLLETLGAYSNQDVSTLLDNTTLGDFATISRGFYLQKRLKDGINFPIIREYVSSKHLFGVASNGLTYKPRRKQLFRNVGADAKYIQFRFSEDLLDNYFKLYKMALIIEDREIEEQ